MSQRKEKYLRKALKEANRLEGVAMELAGMGTRLEDHLTGTDRRLARNIRDTQQLRDELTKQRRRIRRAHRAGTFPTRLACAAFILAAVALLVAITRTPPKEEAKTPVDSMAYVTVAMTPIQAGGLLDQGENSEEVEEIVTAMLRQTYLSDEIPLSYEEQEFLRDACEESGIPYTLALAVIEKETNFNNVAGDGGDSIGYMQVAPKWHEERMARLGVTDLWEPSENFRTGCDFLAELLATYGDTHKALMVYNMGPGRAAELWEGGTYETKYSRAVMERAETWAEILPADAGGPPSC